MTTAVAMYAVTEKYEKISYAEIACVDRHSFKVTNFDTNQKPAYASE